MHFLLPPIFLVKELRNMKHESIKLMEYNKKNHCYYIS
nr:MAG TPA: hypothetical protein [Caudoviricetes sp.]